MGETFYIVVEVSNGRRTVFSTLEDAYMFVKDLRELTDDDTKHGVKYNIYKAKKIISFVN